MNNNIFNYKTAMAMFRQWQNDGIISHDELQALERELAEKYGLSIRSIFRQTP